MTDKLFFNASIVLFRPNEDDLRNCIETLKHVKNLNQLFIIENSPGEFYKYLKDEDSRFHYIPNEKNLGYGAAHNLALRETLASEIPYHLVLNIDTYFQDLRFNDVLDFLEKDKSIGILAPMVLNLDLSTQNSAKLLPHPIDLIIRRFLPNNILIKRRAKYQIEGYLYDNCINAPFISGCFMMIRSSSLKDIGLFDEKFFMYCEDLDLSRRIHTKYKTVLNPSFRIVHKHEKSSFKSSKMLIAHIKSAIFYFNKYGWFKDLNRGLINDSVMKSLKSNRPET